MTREDIMDCFPDEVFTFADGYDDAIMGVDTMTMRVIYSEPKIVKTLMERDGMSDIDALEFYVFNIQGSYAGEKTPIFCSVPQTGDIEEY